MVYVQTVNCMKYSESIKLDSNRAIYTHGTLKKQQQQLALIEKKLFSP